MAAGKLVQVSFAENYAILCMKNGENKLNIESLKEINSALDEIERCKKVQFLITTGDGKFYSNGFDQAFLKTCTTEEFLVTLNLLYDTSTRLLTFPVLTVAALNGHAFAAGALLALAHDYRVMRTNRGWFCLPEVKYGMRFGKGNMSLIKVKIKEPMTLTDAVLMGHRFTAEEALSGGIVQKICDADKLLDTAVQMGQTVISKNAGLNRNSVKQLKSDLYSDVISALQNDISNNKGLLYGFSMFGRKSKL